MIKPLSLLEMQKNFKGDVINGDANFYSVSTDTRAINSGDLFVALQGDNYDAHNFLATADDAGACALVVSQKDNEINLPQWLVSDTTVALGDIAKQQRQHFSGKLVAITGSGGKTTVKEMLASILQDAAPDSVFATKGNLNNHIGVPLSLLSLTQQHRYAVIEMGASALGEIDYLTHIASPHVALVNNVMPAHVEGFGSVDNIANAKGEIYDGLVDGGVAVINIDDKYAGQWLQKNNHRNMIAFSCNAANNQHQSAHVRASAVACDHVGCPVFQLHINDELHEIQLRVLGEHNVANALAAASCAYALGVRAGNIVSGLQRFHGVTGRLQRLEGVANAIIIDDSYNANPGSMHAAIDVLSAMQAKKILVLGDMGELGDLASRAHQQVGEYAKHKHIDGLMAVGELSHLAVSTFGDGAAHFATQEELIAAIKGVADSSTVLLIKGSRSSHMDRVVSALKKLSNRS